MNKLSAIQTEAVTEKKRSIADFSDVEPMTQNEIDDIVYEARRAQARVAAQMVKTAAGFIARSMRHVFAGIRFGLSAATSYDELNRLSDRELSDIGMKRHEIARFAVEGSVARAAMTDFVGRGNDFKLARPTNDWVDDIAA